MAGPGVMNGVWYMTIFLAKASISQAVNRLLSGPWLFALEVGQSNLSIANGGQS
jgi:hypothetical protein